MEGMLSPSPRQNKGGFVLQTKHPMVKGDGCVSPPQPGPFLWARGIASYSSIRHSLFCSGLSWLCGVASGPEELPGCMLLHLGNHRIQNRKKMSPQWTPRGKDSKKRKWVCTLGNPKEYQLLGIALVAIKAVRGVF